MAFGSKDKGQANETAFKTAADTATAGANTAVATAAAPDPIEEMRRKHVIAMQNWQDGVDAAGNKVPIDVRNMPGADVAMGLFNDSLKVRDAGRMGKGYGSLTSSANPNFVAAKAKEDEMTRHLAASGALEENVGNAIASNTAEETGLYQTADNRNLNIAGIQTGREQGADQRYINYLMRPKPPNFFRELAMNAAKGAGAAATMG